MIAALTDYFLWRVLTHGLQEVHALSGLVRNITEYFYHYKYVSTSSWLPNVTGIASARLAK